jgi:F0F1-type ATP synthase delta subunit
MGVKDFSSGRGDVHYIPFQNMCVILGSNIRSQENVLANAMEKLESIRVNGILGAFIGYTQKFSREEIEKTEWKFKSDALQKYFELPESDRPEFLELLVLTAGESRLTAIHQIVADAPELAEKFQRIPFRTEPANSGREQHVKTMLTENDSQPLTQYEQGLGYEFYYDLYLQDGLDFKKVYAEIAAKVGKSETHVRNCLALVRAPKEVQQLVSSGAVSNTIAVETIKTYGQDAAKEVLQEAAAIATTNGKGKVKSEHVTQAKQIVGATPKTRSKAPKGKSEKLGKLVLGNTEPEQPQENVKPVATPKYSKEVLDLINAAIAIRESRSNPAQYNDVGYREVMVLLDEWRTFEAALEAVEY